MLTIINCLISAFVCDLQQRLPTEKNDPKTAAALLDEVNRQVKMLVRYADKTNHGMHGNEDLEREGTSLWNLCSRLSRDPAMRKSSSGSEIATLLVSSRVAAYNILHLSQWSCTSSLPIVCHLMGIALKASRFCTGSCSPVFDDPLHEIMLLADVYCPRNRYSRHPNRKTYFAASCRLQLQDAGSVINTRSG